MGNGYINRHITGAIVQRQPFGGWKKSSFGAGAKAGGPNYVASLGRWTETRLPTTELEANPEVAEILTGIASPSDRILAAAGSYTAAWDEHFGVVHDPSRVRGEVDGFRYRSAPRVLIRLYRDGDPEDALLAVLAAHTCGTPVSVSMADGVALPFPLPNGAAASETDEVFAARLVLDDRVRAIGTAPDQPVGSRP